MDAENVVVRPARRADPRFRFEESIGLTEDGQSSVITCRIHDRFFRPIPIGIHMIDRPSHWPTWLIAASLGVVF